MPRDVEEAYCVPSSTLHAHETRYPNPPALSCPQRLVLPCRWRHHQRPVTSANSPCLTCPPKLPRHHQRLTAILVYGYDEIPERWARGSGNDPSLRHEELDQKAPTAGTIVLAVSVRHTDLVSVQTDTQVLGEEAQTHPDLAEKDTEVLYLNSSGMENV